MIPIVTTFRSDRWYFECLQTAGYDDNRTTVMQFTITMMKKQLPAALELEQSFPAADVALATRLRYEGPPAVHAVLSCLFSFLCFGALKATYPDFAL